MSNEIQPRPTVVLLSTDRVGHGDDELGAVLMRAFLKTLPKVEPDLTELTVLFLNGGVHLTTEGSTVLDDLHVLLDHGAELFSCGTCLDFFGKPLVAGERTNMADIVTRLGSADRVIRP